MGQVMILWQFFNWFHMELPRSTLPQGLVGVPDVGDIWTDLKWLSFSVVYESCISSRIYRLEEGRYAALRSFD